MSSIPLYHWRWSESSQWPPISSVMSADIWRSPAFETLRSKLASARPQPTMVFSEAGFMTMTLGDAKIPLEKGRYT